MEGQTRKGNIANKNSSSNTLRNNNTKRYRNMARNLNAATSKNRANLTRNQLKLEKNLVKLKSNALNNQIRLSKTLAKEGSKISKKILDNRIITNTVKKLVSKRLSVIPGASSILNRISPEKNTTHTTTLHNFTRQQRHNYTTLY
jgi:hypothetical protein